MRALVKPLFALLNCKLALRFWSPLPGLVPSFHLTDDVTMGCFLPSHRDFYFGATLLWSRRTTAVVHRTGRRFAKASAAVSNEDGLI